MTIMLPLKDLPGLILRTLRVRKLYTVNAAKIDEKDQYYIWG